jgi:Zn-dependent protease
LLDDLDVWLFYPSSPGREEVYIVGSITADRYLTVPGSKLAAVRAFIAELDGQRSLDQAREGMMRERGVEIDVEALYRKFERAGLVVGQSGKPRGDLERASAELLRLPIDRLLRGLGRLAPLAPIVMWLGAAAIAAALMFAALDPAFRRPIGVRFALEGGLAAALAIGTVSIAVHELSHCYAASCWGIASGTVKVQLYLGVIPIVGLKLAGLYTLPPRGRLAIWGAGVFFNLTAAAAALLALRAAPGSALLSMTASFNWILVVFNLMPLLPTDGYFMLSTLVRDSNVRVRAWDWLRRPFRQRRRPSAFVLAYVLATVWLLSSTLLRLVGGIAQAANGSSLWRSAASAGLLILFLVTLRRAFRPREGAE